MCIECIDALYNLYEMTEDIRIYPPEGGLPLYIAPMSKQARIVYQLMGEYYIELPFNTILPIPFTAGCYIKYDGFEFFLKKDAFPEPISGVDGYKYVLKFYAPQHHLERCMLKWNVGSNIEVTFTLTTTLDEFAKLLVNNMSAFQNATNAGFRWSYATSNRIDTREVTFDGISCWEAMQRIAEAFGVEWWVNEVDIVTGDNELQINFGKLAEGPYEEIREGEVVTRFPASKRGEDENYGTRFYIYGGAKNIPDDYYENVTGGVTNHISEKRLHLPNGKEYIDVLNGDIVDTLPNGRIIERVIFLDDVFPHNTSTVSAIEEREEEVIEGRKDKIYSISSVDSEFEGTDEEVLSSLGITFTSGALSGSSFDVRWNKPFEQKFHIQPKVEGTGGSEQMVIPNEFLRPEVGDTFVLTGIKLPQENVTKAESELWKLGVDKAKEYGSDTNVYDCKTDPVYCQNNKKNYRLGTRVKLIGGAFGEEGRQSRIQGFEKALWNEYDAIYNVGDNTAYSRVKAVAKSYANNSGRIVRQETTRWENRAKALALSAGNADVTNQVKALIGNDPWMSAREIAEDVLGEFGEASLEDYLKKNDAKETYATIESLNKKANKSTVDTLIGNDVNKSVRTIANEVLAGASTGGEIDLSLYLSKSEAETTYATKESLETANDSIDGIATRLGKAETDIVDNSNLLSQHSQQLLTLQTEQESQKATIQQQGATILSLDLEVDGVKGGISEANKAIEAIETELEDKADKSVVDSLSKDLVSTKAVIEIISPQVNANADAIKGKASQEAVDALSESVTTLEGSVEEISNRVDDKADRGDVQTLVSQINNKVEQTTYNNKVAELEASIKTNDEEITKVDGKADNALDKADKALADISELDASVKSSFDDLGATFDALDSVITGINTTATNALTKATEVEIEVDTLSKNVASNTNTIAEHTEIVTMLNNRCDSIEGVTDNNESNIERLGQDVKDVENTLGTLNTTILQVSTKADNAVSTAESASQKANTANQTASSANATANEASVQVTEVAKGVAQNKAKIEAIEEDYISKGDAVDFATDLTGVVEATAGEFVYRPSAGEKSIRDKSAVIRRIKGNSVVWEQKLKSPSDENANWQGYTSSMLTTEIQGREMRCTLTGASVATNPYQVGITGLLPLGSVGGHKYLFCAWVKVSYLNGQLGNNFTFEHDFNSWTLYPAVSEVDKWTFVSRIWESPKNNNRSATIRPPWAYTGANGAKAGDWYAIKDAMFFDLTAMFGAGNEPATVEEFRKVYNDAYYPYCQPELRGVKTGAIKTVGFNLFDGNCARVIGGMTYIVSNYAAAYYSETKNGAQTAVLIKDGVYTPECSGYLHLTGTADATPCVHFQHSGVMDGECAPYEEHTLNLPEILKLFRNGMHAVGDVFDEINIDTYIQRCEYRDYVEGDESNAEVLTDGVHTVAKLTEPIITPLSEPIALDYYCEDWGSEEAIPTSSASAPFRADIVYQFNAEGRIRDNSRNIDKLEKIVAPLRNIPSSDSLATKDFVYAHIPTRVATATERIVVTVGEEKQNLLPNGDEIQYLTPNMLYDYGATSYDKIELPNLLRGDVAFNNKWMVRFASLSSDNISIPFDVFWKDGIAPSWSAWCLCEMTFFKDAEGLYTYGEWKIYK